MSGAEKWLVILALDVTLESSAAAALSFARMNSAGAYAAVAVLLAAAAVLAWRRLSGGTKPNGRPDSRWLVVVMGALAAPLMLLAFRPVEEIDSINYLHYLIDWMANRATPYTFATNYVAF